MGSPAPPHGNPTGLPPSPHFDAGGGWDENRIRPTCCPYGHMHRPSANLIHGYELLCELVGQVLVPAPKM